MLRIVKMYLPKRALADTLRNARTALFSHAKKTVPRMNEPCLFRVEAGMRDLYCTLPLSPRIHGLDYYGDCQPAGDVGSDFYDLIPGEPDDLALSVGDVPMRGQDSAILTPVMRTLLRNLSGRRRGAVSDVVHELNRAVCQISPEDFYATLFYASLDTNRRQLDYVNAGHEPALLVRKQGGRAKRLESTGTVLGLTSRAAYKQRRISLEPGDILVAFTDGVSEALDPQGSELRDTGILNVVRQHPDARSTDMVHYIMDATGRSSADDRTVVVVRLLPPVELLVRERHAADAECVAA